jgi:hypothetical protein
VAFSGTPKVLIVLISYEDILNLTSEGWEIRLNDIKQVIETFVVLVEDEVGLPDKEKFDIYITSLIDLAAPQMSTKKWSAIVQGVQKSLTSFKNMS